MRQEFRRLLDAVKEILDILKQREFLYYDVHEDYNEILRSAKDTFYEWQTASKELVREDELDEITECLLKLDCPIIVHHLVEMAVDEIIEEWEKEKEEENT